jgi:uncharacterized protein (TIGR03435 family)
MTPSERDIEKALSGLPSPSKEEMEATRERIFTRLKSDDGGAVVHPLPELHSIRGSRWRWLALVPVAAAIVLAVFIGTIRQQRPFAVVDVVDGSLHRVVEGKVQPITTGQTLNAGETVQSKGGGTLKLADGSRVEMRAQSEITLERADDGVRIHLRKGDLLVHAAKQVAGHLFVQTRDVTVSVVGTVFLVNAEEEGSRVAVIEGEVHVQHGTTSKNLLPGEEVSTNPSLKWLPVHEELSRSRTETRLASLPQAAQATAVPAETFEVVSIRLRGAAVNGGRGGVASNGLILACYGSLGGSDERRFNATKYSVYQLILLAYGKDCARENMASADDLVFRDGPEWIFSDQYDIEARIPDGPPAITVRPYTTGGNSYTPSPRLLTMLQNLLADRFKLVLRRETKEMPVYFLTEAKGGAKMTAWKEGDRISAPIGVGYSPNSSGTQYVARMVAYKASLPQIAETVRIVVGRHVLDRTGIPGEFKFNLLFAPSEAMEAEISQHSTLPIMTSPSLQTALESEVGLKLEPGRGPVEFLTIERIERPSEN